MNMNTLTTFFMWCSIINGGILIFWTVILVVMPNFVYETHRRWLPISRDAYNTVIYALLAGFKLLFIVFNLTPYIALSIMRS